MKIFYSETQRRHNPPFEVVDGGLRASYMEDPGRMDSILQALHGTPWAEILPPADFGMQPILAVHAADYMEFLASAWGEWLAMSPEVQASPAGGRAASRHVRTAPQAASPGFAARPRGLLHDGPVRRYCCRYL